MKYFSKGKTNLVQLFVIVLMVVILPGCGQESFKMAIPTQEYELSIENIDNANEQECDAVDTRKCMHIKSQNMPEIEIDGSNVMVNVQNQMSYRKFLSMIDDFENYNLLRLNLLGADIRVCLDDILAGHNFKSLYITGGIIAARNLEVLDKMRLESMGIYGVTRIQGDILSHISSQYIEIELNDKYRGKLPTAEILNGLQCAELIVMWNGDGRIGLFDIRNPENKVLREWDHICSIVSEEDGILKSIYRRNYGEYSFTSYDFYEKSMGKKLCAEFISVKDRGSGGKKYFIILNIPGEKLAEITVGMPINDFHRIGFRDIDFDGYDDIIFDRSYYSYNEHRVVFLWNPEQGKYEYCGTAPRSFENSVSIKEHKAYYFYPDANAGPSIYSIYEYVDGCFIRHSLEIEHRGDSLVYVYHREGEWVREQEFSYQKEDRTWHAVHEENGMTIEESMSEDLAELECAYFPEFTYIWQNRIR